LLSRTNATLRCAVIGAINATRCTNDLAISALLRSLADLPPNAIAAARVLQRTGRHESAVCARLLELLNGEDAGIAWEASTLLEPCRGDPPKTIAAFIRLLHSKNDRLRGRAAIVLGNFGGLARTAEPDLRAALKDEYAHVREAAVEALRRIGAEP